MRQRQDSWVLLFGGLAVVLLITMIVALVVAGSSATDESSISTGVATPYPTYTPYPTFTPVSTPEPPALPEYRCLRGKLMVGVWDDSASIQFGEMALCGYGLSATDYVGPTIEARLNSEGALTLHPIGTPVTKEVR